MGCSLALGPRLGEGRREGGWRSGQPDLRRSLWQGPSQKPEQRRRERGREERNEFSFALVKFEVSVSRGYWSNKATP